MKVIENPRFHESRILVLMNEGRLARQTCANLESLRGHCYEKVSTVAAAVSVLQEREIDVIVSELNAECSAGLRLPSMLKEWNAARRLTRVPHVLLVAKGRPDIDADMRTRRHLLHEEAFSVKALDGRLNGVPWAAIASHARLARGAGIHLDIAQDEGIDALSGSLKRLEELAYLPCPPDDAQLTALPSEEEVISALATAEGLRVVYQPQFDLESMRMVGAEALIRWRHPRCGEVPPAILLPLVHRLGMDLLLFSFTETCAIETLLALNMIGVVIPIAVNASVDTICADGLADRLADKMRHAGLPASRLKIELTEESGACDVLRLSASIAALRAKGFHVSLDDFGAGAATLALLSQIPFDEIKVDGAMVRSVEQVPAAREIVAGVVGLARTLNFQVVMEGIEDEATTVLLRELGCHIGQGFFLGRPMEAAHLLRSAMSEAGAP